MKVNGQAPAEKLSSRLACQLEESGLLANRRLLIASNRGPVTFRPDTDDSNGAIQPTRSSGGLVTALTGLAQITNCQWIACSQTPEDRQWGSGQVDLSLSGQTASMKVTFISPETEAYEGYYNVISNPLLWFLQHNMWDMVESPNIDHEVWQAWEDGYVEVNRLFAQALAQEIANSENRPLVMLHDYHLYLTPRFLRQITPGQDYTLMHFIHIPWPGAEDWSMLPTRMNRPMLEGLCAVDLLGFQTREDGLNFLRTCESCLPGSEANYKQSWVEYAGHITHVRDFPISIDVQALHQVADSPEVSEYRQMLLNRFGDYQLIVRIDRLEPSKNIIRGFTAYSEMLKLYPEHQGKVMFLAFLVPSRLGVDEYQHYLDLVMAAAGRVNATYGDSEWEPVRVIVGENFQRAVAAMQIYDVLLVNSVADGMNLVAKEGPSVNTRNGVVVLSDRTGARQQLEAGSLLISPLDIYATAQALHMALTMQEPERRHKAEYLQRMVAENDIFDWLCDQIKAISELGL